MDLDGARQRISQLQADLQRLVERDPEQEVTGWAVPVVDAVLRAVRDLLPRDPILSAVDDLISVDNIEAGAPLRAADALIIVGQVAAAIPPVTIAPGPSRPHWTEQGF